MHDVATSWSQEFRQRTDTRAFNCVLEGVSRVVAVLVSDVAGNAQIVILASLASDELVLFEDCDFVSFASEGNINFRTYP